MTDNLEYVSVSVGGASYQGWQRVTVSYSAKQSVRAFALTITDQASSKSVLSQAWSFMPDTPCSVTSNGDMLVQGYIDHMSPSYDAKNHKIEINGSSKSRDHVKSHVDHPTHEWKNKTVLQIANDLDQQGVGYSVGPGVTLKPLPLFRAIPGESIHAAVDRAAAMQQLLLIGQADGSVQIAKGGAQRVHPALIEGQNILNASSVFDNGERKQDYKVKGQRPFGSKLTGELQIVGKATDSGVKRKLHHTIHSPTALNSTDEANKLAQNYRDRQIGESISAKVTLQGFHDANGALWQANTLIYVYSPMLKLSMDLLISDVSLSQDTTGTFARLGLVHPKALGSSAGTGSQTQSPYADPNQDQ